MQTQQQYGSTWQAFAERSIQKRGDKQKSDSIFTQVSLRTLNSNHAFSHEHAALELGCQSRTIMEILTDTLQRFIENANLQERPIRFPWKKA